MTLGITSLYSKMRSPRMRCNGIGILSRWNKSNASGLRRPIISLKRKTPRSRRMPPRPMLKTSKRRLMTTISKSKRLDHQSQTWPRISLRKPRRVWEPSKENSTYLSTTCLHFLSLSPKSKPEMQSAISSLTCRMMNLPRQSINLAKLPRLPKRTTMMRSRKQMKNRRTLLGQRFPTLSWMSSRKSRLWAWLRSCSQSIHCTHHLWVCCLK